MQELPALVHGVLDRLDEVVEVMCRRVYDELPSYRAGTVPPAALRRSVRDNLVPILRSLSAPVPLDLGPARATGKERAEQDAPLPEVLRAFRIGFEHLWQDLVETARETGTASDASLVDAATSVWRLTGECTDAIAAAYRTASMELAVRLEHRRSALLDALFLGTLTDKTTLWEAAEALEVPLTDRFLVLATAPADTTEPVPANLDARLRRRGVRATWRWQPDALTGLLVLGASVAEAAVVADLEAVASGDIGVSGLFGHLREAPDAVHGARVALTTLSHQGRRVVQYDTTPLAMLVSAAPAEAERVAREVFGALLALKPHESAVLTRTLRAWCASDGSPGRAAEALHCHANTIRYRLRRIEDLTGRSLRSPRDLAEIVTALNALRVIREKE
ncbi:helix-turn-helix domain-containing protein [Amycolatopsis sp. NBC_00345]|uniref:PucR family transcriptional regulator n=1 Tax=Amycolatopsis sp. NBC_00345 TaxID=2975955 RepID=UPI002E256DD1